MDRIELTNSQNGACTYAVVSGPLREGERCSADRRENEERYTDRRDNTPKKHVILHEPPVERDRVRIEYQSRHVPFLSLPPVLLLG